MRRAERQSAGVGGILRLRSATTYSPAYHRFGPREKMTRAGLRASLRPADIITRNQRGSFVKSRRVRRGESERAERDGALGRSAPEEIARARAQRDERTHQRRRSRDASRRRGSRSRGIPGRARAWRIGSPARVFPAAVLPAGRNNRSAEILRRRHRSEREDRGERCSWERARSGCSRRMRST